MTSAPFSLRTSSPRPRFRALSVSSLPVREQGRVRARLVPCGSCLDLAVLAEGFPDSLGKSLQLLGIKAAELSCLGSQMPVADKLAERDLFCLGSSLIIKGCFFCIFFPESTAHAMKLTRMESSSQPGKGTDIDNVFTTCKTEK